MPKRSEGLPEEHAASTRALGRAIGRRIRVRRVQLQLSQEQVRAQMELEHVYVSRTQFSRIETGASLPNAAELIALMTILRVQCAWLLFGPEEPFNGSDLGGDEKQV
ncbi:MAG: helix-turn-helix domain-containing protein [Dehalococcoidia bacterium]